ncbi:MAG: hypothetical protein HYS13_20400 [Planctomycetia bacterium]|nr:hypothetical protein [Planctomycetia bacterium]
MRFKPATWLTGAALVAIALTIGGCIAGDQLTTITIHPDGSAEFVKFQSNIRSTETGEKAAEELRGYVEEFAAQRDADSLHIRNSGGEIVESRWIRSEAPYANVLVARFPRAAALEAYFTYKGEQGESQVVTRFTQDGRRRKLSFTITVPKDGEVPVLAQTTIQELRASQANGMSEMRFVVAGGKIVASRGFTLADDKQSALLALHDIQELLKTARDTVELFLEWELAAE